MQIDMDTIETSNLNRQFLFRKRHVGESKAKVAAEAVKRFRPHAEIQADQVLHYNCPCKCPAKVAAYCEIINAFIRCVAAAK